jgi:hypothetical protein
MRSRFAFTVALACGMHAALPAYAQKPQDKPAPAAAPKGDLLAQAQDLFDKQQYEESIQTLTAALVRPDNTKQKKVEIYKLLAFNLITLNRKDEAESAVRGLLSLQPDYELPRSESPRFRDFFTTTKQKWEAEGRPGLVKETEAPPAPVAMQHSSPAEAKSGTQVSLTARLEDPQGRVHSVRLYFRTGTKGKFTEQDATLEEGTARTSIPPSAVKPPFVEYYFIGFDAKGEPVVSRGDAGAPLRIAVPDPRSGGSSWILPVSLGVVGAGALTVGILALAGVFKSSSTTPPGGNNPPGSSNVVITFGE